MAQLTLNITMSLDGFIAGPNQTLDEPLGEEVSGCTSGSSRWRAFANGTASGAAARPAPMTTSSKENLAATGAVVMGRRMFSGGAGPWEDDPNADGWWGDEPPFHVPVFVLTHHARETVNKQRGTSFTFVTGGIEAALDQA